MLFEQQEVPRDRWGRPLVVPPDGGKTRGYSRASSYGDIIESTWNLDQWRKRMVAIGVAGGPDLAEEILGQLPNLDSEDGETVKSAKRAINELADTAMERAGSNARAELGTYVHGLTELVDRGEELPDDVSDEVRKDLDAYWRATREFEMLDIEQFVVCDELEVAGTFDRRVRYQGQTYIFDLKTSTSTDFGGTKFGVQLACYAHGVPYDFETEVRTPWDEPVNQEWGIILHLPAGEARAEAKWIDLREGWKCALLSQAIRQQRRFRRWYKPVGIESVDEASPYGPVFDVYAQKIQRAETVDEARELYSRAVRRGVSGDELLPYCLARKAELETGVSAAS